MFDIVKLIQQLNYFDVLLGSGSFKLISGQFYLIS